MNCECRKGMAAGAAMTKYICGECKKDCIHGSTGIPKICIECEEKLEKCGHCGESIDIEKKTSEEWIKQADFNFKILDHDGWDRKNFDFSYYEELITAREFNNRVFTSTIGGLNEK